MFKILAFGHKSRCGKDTATKFLVNYIQEKRPNLKVQRRAFADEVKAVGYRIYKQHGLQPGPYYDEHSEARTIKLPLLNLDPVEIWVAIGDKLREIYSESWVDLVVLDKSVNIVIISDLRYVNEAERVLELGGVCVKLSRKNALIRNTKADNALNDFTKWYRLLDNDGSEQELENQMIKLIDDLGWLKG